MSTLTETPTSKEAPAAQKCVVVVFNPVSGTSDPEQRKKAIGDALERYGYTCQFLVTAPDVEVKATVDEAVREGADLIVVAGGDGTVMEVLSALVDTDVPAAIVPSGTGNLLSINLGIPGAVPEAIEVALEGKVHAIDLARARVRHPDQEERWRHFAIMGGVGLDAQMIRDADRGMKRRWGVLAYLGAILKNLPRRRVWASVSVDGRTPIRRPIKTVMIANMAKMIGGLDANPAAVPNDGLLDVGIITPASIGQWLHLLGMTILGRPQDSPFMDVFQGRSIKLTTSTPQPVEFDGESYGETTEVTCEVLPGAAKIMLPSTSPALEPASGPTSPLPISRLRVALIGVTIAGLVAGIVRAVRRRR